VVVAVGIASAAAWLLLDELAWPARSLTAFLLVPLPALLLAQARMAHRIPAEADREEIYVSSAISVWVLAVLAMLAARFSDFTRDDLRLTELPVGTLVVAASLTTLAGLVVMALGKFTRVPDTALLDYLIPRSSSEKIAFAGLSVSAGIAEELVFRSFLIAAIEHATGSTVTAVVVSVAVFAISHSYQGVAGGIRVAILGLILTAPFLVTGSVYPAMAAHTALDLLAGLVLNDWLRSEPDSPHAS
jgi:membrane protease YdiL (CAAX protease family)